jgi:hypothetical protein
MEEHLRPSPNARKWTTCNVVKEGKTIFRMYLDDNQTCFMLSAKRVGDAFYISQYESFPEVSESLSPCVRACVCSAGTNQCTQSQSVGSTPAATPAAGHDV